MDRMGSLAEGMEFIGDRSIWELPKTAFLCSRKVPAAQVLKCYDWTIAMREAGQCVMLGAHSPLEKDVLHYLLKGTQPVVLVLARGLLKRMDPVLQAEVDKGRLLVVAPFAKEVRRVTKETADARNAFMLAHAQAVVVGHVAPDGQLASALANVEVPIMRL